MGGLRQRANPLTTIGRVAGEKGGLAILEPSISRQPITDAERRGLFDVLDDRHGNRSTISSSQIPPKRFHEYIAEPTHADAICDRLIHSAHKLVLEGPSRRDKKESPEK